MRHLNLLMPVRVCTGSGSTTDSVSTYVNRSPSGCEPGDVLHPRGHWHWHHWHSASASVPVLCVFGAGVPNSILPGFPVAEGHCSGTGNAGHWHVQLVAVAYRLTRSLLQTSDGDVRTDTTM